MSKGILASVVCAACSSSQEVWRLASSSAFGYPDLDGRPASPSRGEVYTSVQRCEHCGYCAGNIETPPANPNVLQQDAYRAILNDEKLISTCRNHLCVSFIKQHDGQYASAAKSALNAAWVCDNQKQKRNANACRKQAIKLLELAHAQGQRIYTKSPDHDLAVMADMLRRSCQFKQGKDFITKALTETHDVTVIKLLQYQLRLIESKDQACHTAPSSL